MAESKGTGRRKQRWKLGFNLKDLVLGRVFLGLLIASVGSEGELLVVENLATKHGLKVLSSEMV